MRPKRQDEGIIKDAIMTYLRALPGCYPRVVQIGMIPGRRNVSKGMLDIVAVYKGETWWFEVKCPGEKPSPEQQEFIECWNRCAGKQRAVIVYSLSDVMKYIKPIQTSFRF